MNERERRLVFGEVAELYDASRPTYPDALVADLVAWAGAGGGPPTALEVGAGTGIATRLLAAAGVSVLAVEPSSEMAAVARRTTSAGAGTGAGAVEVVESDFEHAQLAGRRFPLLYAAQAWHWVALPEGYVRAREALVEGGRLVAFWNRPRWEESPLRPELNAVYESHVPVELRGGPLHPAPGEDDHLAGQDWAAEVAAVDGFSHAEVRFYDWSTEYSPDGYVDMLGTISEVRLLPTADRRDFLEATHATLAAHGSAFTLPMQTLTCIARAA